MGRQVFWLATSLKPFEVLERIPEIDRRACRNRVQQHFSIETMVDGYERVYSMIFDLEAKRRP